MIEDTFQALMSRVIMTSPLYRVHEFSTGIVEEASEMTGTALYAPMPRTIRMECTTRCLQFEPWDVNGTTKGKVYLKNNALWGGGNTFTEKEVLSYHCRGCGSVKEYWLTFYWDRKESKGTVSKIGQLPSLELSPPHLIAAGMDPQDLKLYRQALTCRNSNFGIAAVAYLRRIVENRTNFLMDLCAARLRSEDPTSPLLEQLEAVKSDWRFSEKIDFAANLLPKSLLIAGQNPISQLHSLASEALHGLSDEESVDVFDACQAAFEHVIKRLKQDHDEDESYRAAMRKLEQRKAKKDAKEML
jgi:hypothetical protein